MNLHDAKNGGKEIRRGHWTYNGQMLRVWITLYDYYIGSQDKDDPPEFRFDRKEPTYYIWFEQGSKTGSQVGGGQFSSLEAAIFQVDKVSPSKVNWEV